MRGKIDRIWHNRRADDSEFWVLSIEGQRYSTWDKSLIANLSEGDLVEFAYSPSGRYRKLTGIKRLPIPAFTTAREIAVDPRALQIVRMSCLRTAAEMLKDAELLPVKRSALVKAFAREFEEHVFRPYGSEKAEQNRDRGNRSQDHPEEKAPKEKD